MVVFVAVAALMVALGLGLLFRPFWMSRAQSAELSRGQLNAAIYRDQFARLDRDRADGLLSDADYDQAKAELQRRVLEDAATDEVPAQAGAHKGLLWVLGLALPLAAVGLYVVLGSPATLDPNGPHRPTTTADIDRMVEGLARKLEKEPDNFQGWVMLGRSYKMLGRSVEAEKAFERGLPVMEQDAQMLAIYADVAASNAKGNFKGKPRELIEKAIKLDPNNAMALWLLGSAQFSENAFEKAIATWQKLLPQLEPESEDAKMLQDSIDEAFTRLGKTPPPAAKAANKPAAAAAGANVSGQVVLDAALLAKVSPTDTLMVIARKPGERMPVAVLRVPAKGFPVAFTLDDALAMSPQARISMLQKVDVEARVSKTGMAQAEPGDLLSSVQTVAVGAKDVALKVNTVRP